METEKTPAAGQPPVMEEHTFSGALFGFRRKDVLDYVRTMSENNEAYIRTLDGSVSALQSELEASREDARLLEERIGELNAAMEATAADDAKKQAEYERTLKEFQACREKLFSREQKYVQLQKECRELQEKNALIIEQMHKAKNLLQQNQQELADAAAREQQLKEEHARALAETALAAQEESRRQAEEAARKEASLQAQHRQELQALEKEQQRELQELDADARQIIGRLSARADAEQERIARGVDRVDAELEELHRDMEQVQQQIWAAHAMIRQSTKDIDDLLKRAKEEPLFHAQKPLRESSYVKPSESAFVPQPVPVVEEQPSAAVAVPAAEEASAEGLSAAAGAVPAEEETPVPEEKPASEPVRPRVTVTCTQPGQRVQRPAAQPQPVHTTVRSTRETVAEHLLDALGRLWEKR